MYHATHHHVTASPVLQRYLGGSLLVHVVVLVALSISISHSIRVSPPSAIQVTLVGVPQPAAAAKKPVVPEKIRTQDSAAPKEPPPEAKNIPPSEAKTKFLTDPKVAPTPAKPNPIEAKERPPVLDKNPQKKKVVKNDLDAKVVKNPEDFLNQLDVLDNLATPNPTPAEVPATQAQAGQGPQLQMNLSDNGAVSAIQAKIQQNWFIPPGKDLRGLQVTVAVSLAADGQITGLRISSSSGDVSFDNSLLRAVRKASPLPIPLDKIDTFREFELTFQQPA